MTFDFKKLIPHVVAIIIFVLATSFYFLPQLSGKKIIQSDIQQFKGMASEVYEYKDKGETILWTNSVFSGMPTFQISAPPKKNISQFIERAMSLFFKRPIGYFILGMIAFYIALLACNVNSWIALLGSLVFSFTTNNMVLFEAGHTSKIRVLMVSVLIIAGVIQTFRKNYIIGALTYVVGMAVSLYCNHFQMTYYLGIVLGIYTLIKIVQLGIKGEWNQIFKSVGLLVLMTIVAVGSSASKIWTTYEYGKTTMRGKPILKKAAATPGSSSATKGLSWEYAMQWSNTFEDLAAIYIPGAAGGGSSEKLSKNSATNKLLRRSGSSSIPYGPLYHGKLIFTSGPQYLGAITFLLFLIALFVVNPAIRLWGILAFFVTIIMSMGNHMSLINQPLFDHLPLLNKFRSPASITSVTAIFVSFIAFLGLNKLFDKKYLKKNKSLATNAIVIVTAALSLICLVYAFVVPSIADFTALSDSRYSNNPELVNAFMKDRASLMRSDALRTLLLTMLTGGLLWAFVNEKINKWIVFSALGIMLLVDLWGVDMRYLNHDSFQSSRRIDSTIQPRPVDNQINKDPDIHYRVHDLTANPWISAKNSLYNKSIGGNHAAKLQRYQDIIDRYLTNGNQSVFNMLNTKYFITGQPGQEQVQQNSGAFGNAWFVSNAVMASSADEEIEAIENMDLRNTASIHNEFTLSSTSFSNAGSIKLTSYHPDKLVYQSSNSGNSLAIFSEVWYGGKGWKAYIDGKEVDFIRANYVLRGLEIPTGTHEIVFEFKPNAYYKGELISMFFSIIILLLIAASIYFKFIKTNKNNILKEV